MTRIVCAKPGCETLVVGVVCRRHRRYGRALAETRREPEMHTDERDGLLRAAARATSSTSVGLALRAAAAGAARARPKRAG